MKACSPPLGSSVSLLTLSGYVTDPDEGSAQLSSLMSWALRHAILLWKSVSHSLTPTAPGQILMVTRLGRQKTHWPVGVHVLLREKHHMEASPSSWPHAQPPLPLCFLESQPATLGAHWAVAFGTAGPSEKLSCVFFERDYVSQIYTCVHILYPHFALRIWAGMSFTWNQYNTVQQSDAVWFLRLSHKNCWEVESQHIKIMLWRMTFLLFIL